MLRDEKNAEMQPTRKLWEEKAGPPEDLWTRINFSGENTPEERSVEGYKEDATGGVGHQREGGIPGKRSRKTCKRIGRGEREQSASLEGAHERRVKLWGAGGELSRRFGFSFHGGGHCSLLIGH